MVVPVRHLRHGLLEFVLGQAQADALSETATPKGRPWAIRLSIEVSSTSTRRDSRRDCRRGSPAIDREGGPGRLSNAQGQVAASGPWPPPGTTAGWSWRPPVIRLMTSSTPTLRAVSKPKVGAPPGSGRSLSMVFGTCATRRPPPARRSQPRRRERGVVPADRHQRADPQLLQRLHTGVQPPVRVGGVLVSHRRVRR